MLNLDDSLTEIDWLNSLRIKKANDIRKEESILVKNNDSKSCLETFNLYPETSYPVRRPNGCEKPSYSYAYLIKLAIESSRNKRMKLNEIYAWIIEKFPYYKYVQTDNSKGWKNAIRHNLSLNKVFKRCAKNSAESGKGSYWTIDSEYGENYIQNPPVKKLKSVLIYPINNEKSSDHIIENMSTNKSTNLFQTSDDLKKISNTENRPSTPTLLNADSNNSTEISVTATSIDNINSTQCAFSSQPFNFQTGHKIDIFTNSFSDRSAFVPYSIHNSISSKISEISNSSCEISYPADAKFSSSLLQTPNMVYSNYSQRLFSNDKILALPNLCDQSATSLDLCEILTRRHLKRTLEIDDGETGNGNDIILKTPVLSQINTTSDFRDSGEENCTNHFQKMIGTETIFDGQNLYDSFLSLHQSLFESDTFDSRHLFPSGYPEKLPCQETSCSQNLFEGSLRLSTNSKNILLNASGLRENWLSGSQWLELCENNNLQNDQTANFNSPNESESYQSTNVYDKQMFSQDGKNPSQQFLEMKNHLRSYRFKSNSLNESYKPSSVSTSSTVKSTDTVHSKSPAYDKTTDLVINNAIKSNDVLIIMDQVSKSQLSEDDDDIDDCFNWETFK